MVRSAILLDRRALMFIIVKCLKSWKRVKRNVGTTRRRTVRGGKSVDEARLNWENSPEAKCESWRWPRCSGEKKTGLGTEGKTRRQYVNGGKRFFLVRGSAAHPRKWARTQGRGGGFLRQQEKDCKVILVRQELNQNAFLLAPCRGRRSAECNEARVD